MVSAVPPGSRRHPLADDLRSLLVILDDLRRAHLGFVRIEPDIPQSAPLAEEIPALIEFDLESCEAFPIGLGQRLLLVQPMFLLDEALNVVENRLILWVSVHGPVFPCERT